MSEIAEQIFHDFIDSMPLGVCLVDHEARIIYWNSAAERISGYLGAEVLGRIYRDDVLLRQAESVVESVCPIKQALRDGHSSDQELFLRHKEGHRVPMFVITFALRNGDGNVVGAAEIMAPDPRRASTQAATTHFERELESRALALQTESHARLAAAMLQPAATTTAALLLEIIEREAIVQHGGAAMLQQAVRVLVRTVSNLVPPNSFVGLSRDWHVLVLIPDCLPARVQELRANLAGVGSACAVKWWGDRIVFSIRTAACFLNAEPTMDALLAGLEHELKAAAGEADPA